LFAKLMGEIRHHVQDEEADLFPRLRSACGPEDLVELGTKVQTVKKISPTRRTRRRPTGHRRTRCSARWPASWWTGSATR
jgi:hypothetical protein